MKKQKKIKISSLQVNKQTRKVWLINPHTKVKPSDKKYKRSKAKRKFRKRLREEYDID